MMDVSLRTLLVRPREAFAAIEEPGLVQPAMLTVVVGVASTVTVLPLYLIIARQLPSSVPRVRFATGGAIAAVPRGLVVGMAIGMAVFGLLWVLTTAVLHVGARLAGGSGPYRHLLAFVGWAHVAQLVMLAVVVGLAIVVAATQDVTVAQALHGPDPLSSGGEVPTMDGEGLMDGRSVLSVAGTLWTAYLWMGGLEVSHDLSRRRAAAVAGVVATVMTLLTI